MNFSVLKKGEKYILESIWKETGLSAWIAVFLSAMVLRSFIERFLAKTSPDSDYEVIVEFIHNIFFFGISFILLWLFLGKLLKINPGRLSFVFLWVTLAVPLPPIFDIFKTGGEVFWSFYLISDPARLFLQYRTLFGHLPSGIVYFGTKIVFFGGIILLSGLVFLKTRNILKTVAGALGSYTILFVMGAFPSFFFLAYNLFFGREKFGDIRSFEIARFFAVPEKILGIGPASLKYSFAYKLDILYFPLLVFLVVILFYAINRKKFMAVLGNLRLPQLFYHGGLFFIGLGLGFLRYPGNFSLNVFSLSAVLTLLLSTGFAWAASVVVNDLNDFEIDAISNPERPLPRGIFSKEEYHSVGWACFLMSLLGGITVGYSFVFLFLVYQILAWMYSSEPLRLKKFPIVATFMGSLASLMILFAGYALVSDGQNVTTLSPRIFFLLLITYTISLPVKDFKDIEGDRRYGIWTIPVIFGEKKARLIVAASLFVSYILSVFFLNELRLFFWAVVFGTLTFLAVTSQKLKPRQLFWPVLGLVTVYGLVLVKIVFLDNVGKFL